MVLHVLYRQRIVKWNMLRNMWQVYGTTCTLLSTYSEMEYVPETLGKCMVLHVLYRQRIVKWNMLRNMWQVYGTTCTLSSK